MSGMTHDPPVNQASERTGRLPNLDALRGLIMILMALDHANHFVAQKHSSGEYWGGPFPAYHDTLPFLTRLVTHLAAPGFFLLMGAGMLLFAASRRKGGWSKRSITGHLTVRGGLLIILQVLIVNHAWELSPSGWRLETYIGVLFALGGTMILGSPLLWLKPNALLALTIILILGTEFLTPLPNQWNQEFQTVARLLLVPGGDLALWVTYPVLPWLELVTFGMVVGHWAQDDSRNASKRAIIYGVIFFLVFILLRGLGGFGNVRPRAGDTWIDFLNVVKYPPSIAFTLLTTGVNLVILGLFGRAEERFKPFVHPLVVFGQVPLFFYIAHLFLYAGLGRWLTPNGTSVPQMIPYWLLGLLILYPLCVWYGRLKGRQPTRSILRFF